MKRNLLILGVCVSIIFRMFTPLSLYFSGGKALSLLIPVILLYTIGKLYKSFSYNIAIAISLFPLLLAYLGVKYFDGYLPESISLLYSIGCMDYYLRTRDEKFAKYTLSTVIIVLVFMTILSLPILIAQPGINRLANILRQDGYEVPRVAYYTISYAQVHAFPLLMIPLFYFYKIKNSLTLKYGTIVLVAAMILTTILSNASASMFMIFIYIFLVILYNPRVSKWSNIAKMGGVGLIVLLIFGSGVISLFLENVQSLTAGTMQERRIEEVKTFIEEGETSGDLESREGLYMISLKTFFSHPFSWEENINNISKHTYLLDHLAAMGLIAFIPFAILIAYRCKKPLKYMSNGKAFYLMAISAFLFLACFKNFFLCEMAFFTCPAIIIYINRHFSEKKLLDKIAR